jgi:pyruvate dehydrogenase E2 component (dihydrolipoamide acetyltransferase)
LRQSGINEEKVSLTALLVKVIGWALDRHPMLNSSLIGDEILVWDEINIGVATALEEGLIVPVIHSADQLSVHEINLQLRALSSRARDGHLALVEVQNGTFTVTNLGMYGIDQFRAIINPPESAILAVGRVIRKPVVINEQDVVEVRPVMNLTLSADHRVVDGVTAARFLAELGQAIENPDLY